MIPSRLSIDRLPDRTLLVSLAGEWRLGTPLPAADRLAAELAAGVPGVTFNTGELAGWDSGLLVFLAQLFRDCRKSGIGIDLSGLPEGVRRLMALAAPENQHAAAALQVAAPHQRFLVRLADATQHRVAGFREEFAFIGGVTLAFLKMLRGRANFRWVDLLLTIQETGAQALPIVSLISLLVGMIFAFIAAIQLALFGAQIYVANVVGIGMARVMGAVMTGIIMSGRTGAAFAAQLGTMQVNEEIDALETLGLPIIEFLVLPRMLALMLMLPLLCIYADLMGLLGGMIVGVGMLNLGVAEYVQQTWSALNLTHFLIGLFHSVVFGVLVAVAGCLRGLQCERSASAVGSAATSAVVTGIVSIVVATLVITFCCQVLGI